MPWRLRRRRMVYERFCCVPLALVLAFHLTLCQLGVSAQLLGPTLTNNTLILTSRGLALSIANPAVKTIFINGKLKIDKADFRPTPTLSRNLTIQGQQGGPEEPKLDFNWVEGMLLVDANAALTFRNVTLTNAARQQTGDVNGTNVIRALALWPTLSGKPASTFQFPDTTTYYAVPNQFNNCTGYQTRIEAQLQQIAGPGQVQRPDPHTIRLNGYLQVQLPVTSGGKQIGSADYVTDDSTLVCSKYSAHGSRNFPWWAGFILGIGLAILVGSVLCVVAGCYVFRTRRRPTKSYAADVESTAKTQASLTATPMSAPGGWTPSGSEQASVPDETCTGSITSNVPATLRSRTLSGVRSGTLEDIQTQLLGMRMQHGLDGVEVGPLLGRGSYGSVFKGRWRGTLVAIKVVESGLSDAGDDGSRESLLSASIAHPNVVACFKICLVRTREADQSSDSGAAQALRSQSLSDADIAAASAAEGVRGDPIPPAASSSGLKGQSLPGSRPTATARRTGSGGLSGSREASRETNRSASRNTGDGGSRNLLLELLGSASEQNVAAKQGQIQTWMLLEYCDRGSLDHAIQMRRFYKRSTQTLDLVSIYRTLVDIAAGVDHLHALGIVHADLKPANVLLKSTATDARGFICKLADFGLSRMVTDHSSHVSAVTMGTVPYMPPEMLLHHRMTKSTDVYSFGVIMNQLFTGEVPFAGMTMPAVLMGVVHESQRPDTSPNQPPDYAALRDRCWDSDPNRRPSFQEIMTELLSQSRKVGPPSRPPAPVTPKQQMQQQLQQQPSVPAPPAEDAAAAATPVQKAEGNRALSPLPSFRDLLPKNGTPDSKGLQPTSGRDVSSFSGDQPPGQSPVASSQPQASSLQSAPMQPGDLRSAEAPTAAPSPQQQSLPIPISAPSGAPEVADRHNHSITGSELSLAVTSDQGGSTSSGSNHNPASTLPPPDLGAALASRQPSGDAGTILGNWPGLGGGGPTSAKPLTDVQEEVRMGSGSDASLVSQAAAARRSSRQFNLRSNSSAQLRDGGSESTRRGSVALTSENSLDYAPLRRSLDSRGSGAPVAAPPEHGSNSSDQFRPLMQRGTSQGGTIRYSLDLGSRSSVRSMSLQHGDRRQLRLPHGLREQSQFEPLRATYEGGPSRPNSMDERRISESGSGLAPRALPAAPFDAASRLFAMSRQTDPPSDSSPPSSQPPGQPPKAEGTVQAQAQKALHMLLPSFSRSQSPKDEPPQN